MNDLTVRFLSPHYKNEVIELYKSYQKFAKTESGAFDWRIKRQFSNYFSTSRSIIGAWDYGKLVGFVAWQEKPILDPYMLIPSQVKNGRREIITWHEQLLVVPNYRRKGIGRRLMTEFLIQINSSGTTIRNICQEAWLVDFYKSLGFMNVFRGPIPKNPSMTYWINERVSGQNVKV